MSEQIQYTPPTAEQEKKATGVSRLRSFVTKYRSYIAIVGVGITCAGLLSTCNGRETPPPSPNTPTPPELPQPTPEPTETERAPALYEPELLSAEQFRRPVVLGEHFAIPPESLIRTETEELLLQLPDGRTVQLELTGIDASFYDIDRAVASGEVIAVPQTAIVTETRKKVPQYNPDTNTVVFVEEVSIEEEITALAAFLWPHPDTENTQFVPYSPHRKFIENFLDIPKVFYTTKQAHPYAFMAGESGVQNSLDVINLFNTEQGNYSEQTVQGNFLYMGVTEYAGSPAVRFMDTHSGIEYSFVPESGSSLEEFSTFEQGSIYELIVQYAPTFVRVESVFTPDSEEEPHLHIHTVTHVVVSDVSAITETKF